MSLILSDENIFTYETQRNKRLESGEKNERRNKTKLYGTEATDMLS